MIDLFKNIKFNIWRFLFAAGVLTLGDWGVLTSTPVFGGKFDWTFLPISGFIALLILLDWENVKKLFGKLPKGAWNWIWFAIVADFILSTVFGAIGKFLHQSTAANAGSESWYEGLGLFGIIRHFLELSFSLLGEELFIATIFILAVILLNKLTDTKYIVWLAGLISLLIFGISHYPVYDGNIYQCLFIIGLGHMPTLYAWLKTETLWVPAIAHILYDIILLLLMLGFGI